MKHRTLTEAKAVTLGLCAPTLAQETWTANSFIDRRIDIRASRRKPDAYVRSISV